MNIIEHNIDYYCNRIRQGERFAFPGYSDAEWICIFGWRPGELSSLGQVLDPGHGQKLLDVLRRRQSDPNFMFAVPKILGKMQGFDEGQIEKFLAGCSIEITAYERDMVTDDLAAAAELYPLVKTVKDFNGPKVMIGNHKLSPMLSTLGLTHFFGIDSPNLHMKENGIEDVVQRVLGIKQLYGPGYTAYGSDLCLFLVSAGVSAAVIIDQLYDRFPKSYFFDCGSMWDAFVGIGAQREWRAKLYADPVAHDQWKLDNLYGKAKHSIPEL